MKSDNVENTEVGIFLNDHGVSKIEYYLSTSVAVDCNVDARTVTTSITMKNSVDRDDLTYAMGSLRAPTYGAPRTSMMLDVLYFAPPGATIDGVDPARGDVPSSDDPAPKAVAALRASPSSWTAARPAPSPTRARSERATSGRSRCATRRRRRGRTSPSRPPVRH